MDLAGRRSGTGVPESAVAVAGVAAVLVAVVAASALPGPHRLGGLILVAAVVGGCAAGLAHLGIAVGLAGLAYVLVHAFVLIGDWSWSGDDNVSSIVLLVLALWLGRGQRWIRAGWPATEPSDGDAAVPR